MMDITKHTAHGLTYFLSDPKPSVLIISGMHGDEYESSQILEQFVRTKEFSLPPFLFIPTVSPSAAALRTRKNSQENDINRQFRDSTTDVESQSLMKVLKSYHFSVVIDIHEDPDRTQSFYIYDTARMSDQELATYRDLVHETDARLYTGMDDIEDENLGCEIEEGYYSFVSDWSGDTDTDAGFLSKWAISSGVAKRVFTVEIPGKAPQSRKQALITRVVPYLSETFSV